MRWASAISRNGDLDCAVEEVGDAVRAELGAAADLTIAFVSPQLGPAIRRLPSALAARLPSRALIGCSAGGVIGDGREVEGAAALSVTAATLPGVRVDAFHLGSDPDDWPARVAVDPDDDPAFVLLPEPFTCDAQHLVRWFDAAFPRSVKVGGLASGAREPGANALFCGEESFAAGAVGVALRGNVAVDTVVAQGCRPIGTPMFVTKRDRNIIFELDGRPAVGVIQDLYESLSPRDRELFRHSLFLGLVMREAQQLYEQGDFLIRNLAGIDPARNAIVVQGRVEPNQVVQFHLRDARTSAEDLDALLAAHRVRRPASPAGALLFSCLGRGMHLYGRPDHDTDLFRERIGPVPLGGFFCNGEIGQVQGSTFLHGYTSSFGLFRPRE